MKIRLKILGLMAFLFVLVVPVHAESVPHYLGYEGQLKNASDEDLTGDYDMVFKIYDALTSGNLLWTEPHTDVSVSNGYFSVQLGSATDLDLTFDKQYFVSLNVEADGEMTPRQTMNSVGYSYASDIAFGVYVTSTPPTTSSGKIYYDSDDGNLYVYDNSASTWVDLTDAGSAELSDLSDVNTSTATNGYILMADGSAWGSVAQTMITQVGTIATGTWNGTAISNVYGGTGQNTSGWTGLLNISSGAWATTTISTSTRLTLSAGALALSDGYHIPLTASTTNWETAYSWGSPAGVYMPLAGGTFTGTVTTTDLMVTGKRKSSVYATSTAVFTINDTIASEIYHLTNTGARTTTINIDAEITIKDAAGTAATNNIVILPGSGTIDGEASITINQNYGSVIIYKQGDTYFQKKKLASASGIAISSDFSTWGYRAIWAVPGDNAEVISGVIRAVVPYDSNMEADFSDVRFTDYDGTEVSANRWKYSSGSWAIFHVQVPTIPTGGTLVQMYYDKSSQTVKSDSVYDADTTINFSGSTIPSGWGITSESGFSIVDGVAKINGALYSEHNAFSADNMIPDGAYVVESKIRSSDWDRIHMGLYDGNGEPYDDYIYLLCQNTSRFLVTNSEGGSTTVAVQTLETSVWYYMIWVRDPGNDRAMMILSASPYFNFGLDSVTIERTGGLYNSLFTDHAIIGSGRVNNGAQKIEFLDFDSNFTGVLEIDDIATYKLGSGAAAPVMAYKEAL